MAFLRNHQMFLQVFSKKVCFCCILGCFAEKKLPQMSQILTDGACLEFYEFCVLWEYSSPTDCTDQHRWLVALIRPRNSQNSQKFWGAVGCVSTAGCHTLLNLCKSVLSVGDFSLQEASVRSVGSVGEYRLLGWCSRDCCPPEIASVPSVEVSSQQEISVRSVGSVGGYFMNVAAWVR